jgi:hypothetical protein
MNVASQTVGPQDRRREVLGGQDLAAPQQAYAVHSSAIPCALELRHQDVEVFGEGVTFPEEVF